MTDLHSIFDYEPELTEAERIALANVRRKALRRKAMEELALHKLQPFACIVIDRATGEHFLMASPAPASPRD